MSKGNLFVISGPSGAGKGTLVARLKETVPDTWVSISATTRAPRPGEVDGASYYFLSRERFEELIAEDGFLEWAEYNGNLYGTPRFSVEDAIAQGKQVILEIEVQGASIVKGKMPEAKTIFVEPPSLDELEKRLRGRGTEDEQTIQSRLRVAEVEMDRKMEYDMRLVNDNLDEAVDVLTGYISQAAVE